MHGSRHTKFREPKLLYTSPISVAISVCLGEVTTTLQYTFRLNSHLDNIVFTKLEVESVLKTLVVGKASGPNGLSNRILRELASEISAPFCALFNQSLRTGSFPTPYKEANVCPVPKNVICLLSLIIDQYLCLTLKVKSLRDSFLNIYSIIYNIITYLLPYNQALYRETLLLINLHTSTTHSVRHLILAKRFGLSSVTSAKPLTVYGTHDSCTNFRQLV